MEPVVNFPINEMVNSSDKGAIDQPTASNPGNETFLRCSNRNMGLQKFHVKGYYIVNIDSSTKHLDQLLTQSFW